MESLVVGIQENQGIIDVLEQEGVPYTVLNSITDATKQHVRVIIWEKFGNELMSYVNDSNNALITNMTTLAKIEKRKLQKNNIVTYHAPDNCKLVEGVSGMLLNDKLFSLGEPAIGYSRDRYGNIIEDCGIIYYKGGRNIIAYPWDIFKMQTRKDRKYRPFFSPLMNNKAVIEIGLGWDRGAVRRILFNSIKELFNLLSLPMVRICPRPNRDGNYVIRIDSDGFTRESTDKVLNLSKECGFPFTWFMDVQGHGNNIDVVNRLMNYGQDVQLHCYWHMTYPDCFRNKRNIKKGKEILERYKLQIRGVVSPGGKYSENFQKALEANELSYSSEFGFGVDDLPRWTKPNHKGALQVLVHPLSIGVMEPAAFSKKEICEHWKRVLKHTIDMGYVCILYDHPLDRLENYVDEFKEMHNYCVRHSWTPIEMTQYADWWIMRTNIVFTPRMSDDSIAIDTKSELNQVLFEIYPNGRRIKGVIGAENYFIADETNEVKPFYVWGKVTDKVRKEQRIRTWIDRYSRLEFRLFPWIYTPVTSKVLSINIVKRITKTLRPVLIRFLGFLVW